MSDNALDYEPLLFVDSARGVSQERDAIPESLHFHNEKRRFVKKTHAI